MNTIDINSHKTKYTNNNYVVVNNILENRYINSIYNEIDSKLFNKLWYLTLHTGKKKYIIPHNITNIRKILAELKRNKLKNTFTYYIYRTFVIPKNFIVNSLLKILNSSKFIILINKITGENVTKIKEIFISKYSSNCYLDIHDDLNKGKIAFVLQLTKNWNIDKGGILHMLR